MTQTLSPLAGDETNYQIGKACVDEVTFKSTNI